ncbi:MAG: aldehyde ferredoxin oxidoreductase family protein [candidate division NC10 bacterium]|nr:aldehyde ferredoxin oxidoreductase family protein [candidate division NC10 bacterium]
MSIRGGYFRKMLWVDLDAQRIENRELSEEFILQYIGGRGFGAKLVWDHLEEGRDPLSPSNLIVISPGPLNGCYLPAAGKTSFVSISPLTGIYGDSNMGGSFGVEVRQAGYDGIAIIGRAPNLSYLWIDDEEVRIVPNEALKGKRSLEAEGMIKKEIGDDHVRIATIGPAGENLVRFAGLSSDWGRNAGRCGMGAILGSKNIKAIAVRGSKDLPVYDLARLWEVSRESFKTLSRHRLFEFWQQQGLMSVVDYVNEAGVMPTLNFRCGCFDQASQVNGFAMEDHYKIGDAACFACPMACSNVCLVKEGKYVGTVVEGPEYESACMLGPNLGVGNFACILKANQLCDELGIDTITTGSLIGAMIEALESGLLSRSQVDGLALRWGAEEEILSLVEKIAYRQGVGDILADGSRRVIERWPQLAPIISQVKGLDQSAYDARVAISMALAYGTSDIGAHHARAWTIAKELEMGRDWDLGKKADLVIYHQMIRPLFDMLGVCRLPWIELGFNEEAYAQYFQAITGIDYTLQDLLERSNHVYNLTRMINVRFGLSRKDDYPPPRVFEVPIPDGPQAGKVLSREEYDKILNIYYQKRGWDQEGIPSSEIQRRVSGQ